MSIKWKLPGLFFVAILSTSCLGLPIAKKSHNIRLYGRGIEHKEIGILKLHYAHYGTDSPQNYFYANLYSIAKPFEFLQLPHSKDISPRQDAVSPRFSPQTGASYLKIHAVIPTAFFAGSTIFKFRTRQPFRNRDRRKIEHLLFISEPDALNNILSLDFYLFPSKRGYLLRLDLRPAENFYSRILPGTAANRIADILGDNEQDAIFHNQTLVSEKTTVAMAQYF